MILQTDNPCWKCGSWYRIEDNGNYHCSNQYCKFPDKRKEVVNDAGKEINNEWEYYYGKETQEEKTVIPEKKEIEPDAIQMELDLF